MILSFLDFSLYIFLFKNSSQNTTLHSVVVSTLGWQYYNFFQNVISLFYRLDKLWKDKRALEFRNRGCCNNSDSCLSPSLLIHLQLEFKRKMARTGAVHNLGLWFSTFLVSGPFHTLKNYWRSQGPYVYVVYI